MEGRSLPTNRNTRYCQAVHSSRLDRQLQCNSSRTPARGFVHLDTWTREGTRRPKGHTRPLSIEGERSWEAALPDSRLNVKPQPSRQSGVGQRTSRSVHGTEQGAQKWTQLNRVLGALTRERSAAGEEESTLRPHALHGNELKMDHRPKHNL